MKLIIPVRSVVRYANGSMTSAAVIGEVVIVMSMSVPESVMPSGIHGTGHVSVKALAVERPLGSAEPSGAQYRNPGSVSSCGAMSAALAMRVSPSRRCWGWCQRQPGRPMLG